jgi:uncharacterized protein (DUF1778 family)
MPAGFAAAGSRPNLAVVAPTQVAPTQEVVAGDQTATNQPARSPSPKRKVQAQPGPRTANTNANATSDPRARITLRLDADRHLRLKLAAAHSRTSLQAFVTAAVDAYLAQTAAVFKDANCLCLGSTDGRAQAAIEITPSRKY